MVINGEAEWCCFGRESARAGLNTSPFLAQKPRVRCISLNCHSKSSTISPNLPPHAHVPLSSSLFLFFHWSLGPECTRPSPQLPQYLRTEVSGLLPGAVQTTSSRSPQAGLMAPICASVWNVFLPALCYDQLQTYLSSPKH